MQTCSGEYLLLGYLQKPSLDIVSCIRISGNSTMTFKNKVVVFFSFTDFLLFEENENFEIFNIPENNIISVEAAKVVRYCLLIIEKMAGYQQGPTGRKLFITRVLKDDINFGLAWVET